MAIILGIMNGLVPVTFAFLLLFGVFSFSAVLWNVIAVSLRQTIIPDHLLGRVNSVYRFFAWGMTPIGLVAMYCYSSTQHRNSRRRRSKPPGQKE
jgi:hypothetical protein